MTEVLTAAQMRAIEQAAIDSGTVTGLELMERAGRGVVEAVFEEWPDLAATPHRAVVLCGPGNNGGDGFVVARLLKEQGWQVEVFLYGERSKMPPDARVNYERWEAMGETTPLSSATFEGPNSVHRDLYVDALFGTGLARPIEGDLGKVLAGIRAALWPYERSMRKAERYASVDVPTSLCSDSGRVLKSKQSGLAHFRADLTVTFHKRKVGHFLASGPDLSGKVSSVSIGLEPLFRGRMKWDGDVWSVVREDGAPVLKRPKIGEEVQLAIRPYDLGKSEWLSHKYTHGHALILTGGHGTTGAARLAARGALRIGAGLVTLGVPPSASMEVAAQVTAIMQRRVEGAGGLEALLEDPRFNALCLGPGLGIERAKDLVPAALSAEPTRAVVLDADALTAFQDTPEALFAMLGTSCVLTPHAGEFKRLFPDIAEKLDAPATKGPAYSKVDATREAAARAGCVVLFKGPDTVIADSKGRASINSAHYERAAPWLATAGSGDVLAGFITGLLARGLSPIKAAETAAWLHVECALSFGPGLIAEDLPEELPKVFRNLGV